MLLWLLTSRRVSDDPTIPLGPDSLPKPPPGALFDLGFHSDPKAPLKWQPPSVETLQAALPQYEITAFVARGGMGAVYKGVQKALKRSVAIKVLPPEVEHGDVDYAERFKREAQAMAQLSHPGIVAVHDAGETADGLLYFVMEFIEGSDVAQLIAREGKLEPQRALKITVDVLDALAFAHEEGIIHRDIKPSNIMLDARGRVKVADFGLAKVITQDSGSFTRSDLALGTADFIAPEALIPGTKLDARADLYAVGVMLYQMLTGRIPRGSFDPPSGVVEQLDPRLDAIVLKAMKTDREKRYASAAEMKTAIEGTRQSRTDTPVLPHESSGAAVMEEGAHKKAESPGQAKPARTPLIAAALAVIALNVGGFIYFSKSPHLPAATSSRSESEALKLAGMSSTPSLTGSAPQREWQRYEFGRMPAAEATQGRKGNEMRGDFLRIQKNDSWLNPDNSTPKNAAIRATLNWAPDSAPKLLFRQQIDGGRYSHFYARLENEAVRIGSHEMGGAPDVVLKGFKHSLAAKGPCEVVFAAALLGSRMTIWLDGQKLGDVDGAQNQTPGGIGVQAVDALFRSVEFLNLDGLPEAEALKLAGVSQPSAAATPAPYPAIGANGDPIFPPGVWTRLWTPAEEAATIERKDGDWALLDGRSRGRKDTFTNVGLRARFRGQRVKEDNFPQFNLRSDTGSGTSLNLYITPGGDKLALRQPPLSRDYPALAELWLAEKLKPGLEYTMEFYAIGSTVIGRVNGKTVTAKLQGPVTSGIINLYSANADFLRDVEILPLDGLPEAEALKLAGVSAALATAEAPYPVVDKEGKVVFPSGIWARTLAREVEAEGLAKPATKRDGPWTLWHTGAYEGRCSALNIEVAPMKNLGLRAWFRGQRVNGEDFPQLTLHRTGDIPSPNLHIRGGKLQIRTNQSGYPVLAEVALREPLTPGKEYLAEFYAIGSHLIARVNGQTLTTRIATPPVAGVFQIYGAQWDYFKDAETINLDGLPEAEALKLAGVPAGDGK